jgi:hypothetical protein
MGIIHIDLLEDIPRGRRPKVASHGISFSIVWSGTLKPHSLPGISGFTCAPCRRGLALSCLSRPTSLRLQWASGRQIELFGGIILPVRAEFRWLYPIDWRQLSALVRFKRAEGRCQHCQRPHGQIVVHLRDGRWWDAKLGSWRNGRARVLQRHSAKVPDMLGRIATTRVWLAAAHRDHDPTHNRLRNLMALCQRCHMLHDAQEHRRQRWRTRFRRKAMGDLFLGHY